jgi:hypothetical protein
VPGEFDDWFAPVSRTTVLPQGHLYYRVQLRASYPQPDNTASGAAGGRVTGLYFTTAPQRLCRATPREPVAKRAPSQAPGRPVSLAPALATPRA